MAHKLKCLTLKQLIWPSIRDSLTKAGFKEAQVVSYGTSKDVLISIAPREDKDQSHLVDQVMSALPGAVKQRVDFVGPQVGKELATKGGFGGYRFFVSDDDLYCHAF